MELWWFLNYPSLGIYFHLSHNIGIWGCGIVRIKILFENQIKNYNNFLNSVITRQNLITFTARSLSLLKRESRQWLQYWEDQLIFQTSINHLNPNEDIKCHLLLSNRKSYFLKNSVTSTWNFWEPKQQFFHSNRLRLLIVFGHYV